MNIGFIGAGNVGFSLGKYLSVKGLSLSGFYSRNFNSSLEAASFAGGRAYENIEELVNNTDLILITTQDDEIIPTWDKIKKLNLQNKIIGHCSGSLSSQLFDTLQSGVFFYSIHPIYAFSDKYNDYKKLQSIYFTLEGSKKKLNFMQSFIEGLGNKVIALDANQKPLYHLACVFSSNLVLSLLNIATDYMSNFNIGEEDALEALYPLILNNLSNISEKGLCRSITGPVVRADIHTIAKHLEVIPKEHKELYICLSNNLLKLSKQENPEKDYKETENLLGGMKSEKHSL